MIKHVCILIFLLHGAICATAQLLPGRSAWSNLGKERWLKTELQLKKTLKKDSLNMGAHYTKAWFFFTPHNPSFNIDSAATETRWMIRYFNSLTSKEKEKNARSPFDSTGLLRLKKYVDSAAFERAKRINTEEGYASFIRQFTDAEQAVRAVELQHETAFLTALKENTYQSFASFIDRYPQANRKEEAVARYERLLFDAKTKDKKLTSYAQFLRDYSQSPYRKEAEQHVFEISTASGSKKDLLDFIKGYPSNPFSAAARNTLFHIYKETGENFTAIQNDSLQYITLLNAKTWWPVKRHNTYQLIDKTGKEWLTLPLDSIQEDWLCEGMTHDVLIAGNQIIARNGKVLAQHIEDVTDMGFGFLLVKDQKGYRVIDKSGRQCLNKKAELIGHNFLHVRAGSESELYTLQGRKLYSGNWESIVSLGSVIAFKLENGWRLATVKSLGLIANGGVVQLSSEYDKVERISDQHLVVVKGENTSLLDNELKAILAQSKQTISKEHGLTVVQRGSTRFIFSDGGILPNMELLSVNKDLAVIRSNAGYVLLEGDGNWKKKSKVYDSAYLLSRGGVALRKDTTYLLYNGRESVFPRVKMVSLLSIADTSYLLLTSETGKEVVTIQGERLFSAVCDKIEYPGGKVFIVTRKDKKSLVNYKGQALAVADFDALGNASKNTVAILHKMKFGLVNGVSQKFVKPGYDRNLYPYTDDLIVAWKNGAYGLIDWNDKPQSNFEFEEVRYWNDSVALVKKDFAWRLFRMTDKTLLAGKISSYSTFTSNNETYAIYEQENAMGIMSNKRGVLLEPTYSLVYNIGTDADPFFFTDKYVEEAEIHVVIYYDSAGKLVRRQVLEEAEFQRTVCPDN